MRLRLALYYDYRVHAGTPEEAAKRNQALIQHTALAESCGFDMVWLAEHPTNPEAAMPSALILCAAIAAQTDTMRFGTGVLPLPLYHPLRVAEDAASIDGLGNGRFELGVGLLHLQDPLLLLDEFRSEAVDWDTLFGSRRGKRGRELRRGPQLQGR